MRCVLGPGGMVALKELVELGFDATLFERRKDVGGIWTWTEDRSVTTALKETSLCNSKFSMALSDFPMSSGRYPSLFIWMSKTCTDIRHEME